MLDRPQRPDPPRTRRVRRLQRARQQRPRHRRDRPRHPAGADQHPGGAARRDRPLDPRAIPASSATASPRTRRTPLGSRSRYSAACRRSVSAVTVMAAGAPRQIMNEWTTEPEEILETFAAEMRANMRHYSIWPATTPSIIPQQLREHLQAAGWSKTDIAEFIHERARIHRREWADVGKGAVVRDRGDSDLSRAGIARSAAGHRRRRAGRRLRRRHPALARPQEPRRDRWPSAPVSTANRRRTETPPTSGARAWTFEVLDPTNEAAPPVGQLGAAPGARCAARPSASSPTARKAPRASSPISTGCCASDFGVANVVTRVKSNYSAPADGTSSAEIANWDAVVTGIGD